MLHYQKEEKTPKVNSYYMLKVRVSGGQEAGEE